MVLLRRHFKTLTILLITLIICLSVLLIVDSINDRVNGREPQDFSSSLRKLRPVDVPGVVKQVASRFNGEFIQRDDGALDFDTSDDDDDDEDESDWEANIEGNRLYDDDDEDENKMDERIVQHDKFSEMTFDPALAKINVKMTARKDLLRQTCARLGMRKLNVDNPKDLTDILSHKGNLDTMSWSDKYKFVTSVIYKSGSGNWRKFLDELARKTGKFVNFPPQLQKAHYKSGQILSSLRKKPLEVKYRLKNYLKIVTIRHPLVRLLSGYRDKFLEHTDKYRKDVPKSIIEARTPEEIRALEAASKRGLKRVTFPEFVDFVTSGEFDKVHNDPHWTPQHIRSRPCEIDYDIIAKLESSDDDMHFFKKVIGLESKLSYKKEYTSRHEVTNNKDLAMSYYKLLSEEQLQRACDLYRLDFELFGYYRPRNVSDVKRIFDDFF